MRVLKLTAALVSTLVLALMGATSAEAANPSPHDTIVSGLEYYATANQGNFGGTATSGPRNGLAGTWSIIVYHTTLGSDRCGEPPAPTYPCAHIVSDASHDSSFSLLTTSPGIGLVTGKFKDQSLPLHTPGVVQMGADTACGTQHYVIQDALTGVGPAGSPHSGQGTFYAELWHYRYSFLGRCITWSAFVKGTVVLSY